MNDIILKKCSKCGMELSIDYFYFEKTQNRFRGDCKGCVNKKNYKWKIENNDKIALNLIKNKEKSLQYAKTYRENNKASIKEYYEKNKESIKARDKERWKTDVEYRLKKNLRNRIRAAIKAQDTTKNNSTFVLLGATGKQVALYIESLWQEGMSWENYGFGSNKWHIDHIIPCDSFDLTDIEQQRRCFHYTNLQPLWQKDNLTKSNKLNN